MQIVQGIYTIKWKYNLEKYEGQIRSESAQSEVWLFGGYLNTLMSGWDEILVSSVES